MDTVLEPVGEALSWYPGSATIEVANTISGLRVVVAAGGEKDRFLEVHVPFAKAFQVLDDSDMLEYWGPGKPLGTHSVFRVKSGGWVDRVSGNYFHVTSAIPELREWLVVSDVGPCVTLISFYEPTLREYGSGV
jgi:hypothetical protein